MNAEDTKSLLRDYYALARARFEAKVKMKQIKQALRAAHGEKTNVGWLAALYKVQP